MGKKYLIDTNVVTKYLTEELSEAGLNLLDSIIDANEAQISVISRIELLGFTPKSDHLLQFINQFLRHIVGIWLVRNNHSKNHRHKESL